VRGGQGQAVRLFEEAIAKDPFFAPAYAGLAARHAFRSGFFRSDHAYEAAKTRIAAEKAIQLDPLLAEAHGALGMAHARDAHWEQSEKSFRHAIELDPGRSETYRHFVLFLLLPLGRIEEALRAARTAEKAGPLSPEVQDSLTHVLLSAGRYEEAAGHCEKASPDRRSECMGRALAAQGRIGEAIQILGADLQQNPTGWGVPGYAYARVGRREEAEVSRPVGKATRSFTS
jgi:tetratricopeptide (TPR) repeat protein